MIYQGTAVAAIVHGREILQRRPTSTLCLARELAIIETYTKSDVKVRSCRAELPATKPLKHEPVAAAKEQMAHRGYAGDSERRGRVSGNQNRLRSSDTGRSFSRAQTNR